MININDINPEQLDKISKETYMSHWKLEGLPNNHQAPIWENTSEEVKEWIRVQVKATISSFVEIFGGR